MPHSHGLLHHLAHNFDWAFEVEALTRSHVQLQRNGVQLKDDVGQKGAVYEQHADAVADDQAVVAPGAAHTAAVTDIG